jgi:hypothetical protein
MRLLWKAIDQLSRADEAKLLADETLEVFIVRVKPCNLG